MKPCPACEAPNADDNKYCQRCGRPFEAAPADATVRWAAGAPDAKGEARRAYPLDHLFAAKKRLVIGRAADCDIVLSHPSVSRYHALLERLPGGLRLRDLSSINGVAVGGARVTEPVLVHDGERVGIGPFLFSLAGGFIFSLDSSRRLRLEARDLERVVPVPGGTRKLLDGISLAVLPGEFVGLLGPSGSGKSTLMDCLNGRRRATGGCVLANGEDFYKHFASFRQSLGYVPQKDIVHTQLTVGRALYYTAKLRLPTDTGPDELRARVGDVLREMELEPHRNTPVGNLSGGQVKRVSLGAELLARPCLLYIDEATSGLDAGTEARMMRLFRRLADEGKSLVCITHNVDNVDRCHLVIVLARGKLVYYGPPSEAPGYFGVKRLGEVYDRLADQDVTAWEQRFRDSEQHREFVEKRLGPTRSAERGARDEEEQEERPRDSGALAAAPHAAFRAPHLADRFRELTARALKAREWLRPLADGWHQFRVLTARYAELVRGDRHSLRLLALQAPVVACFLLLGFFNRPYESTMPVLRDLDESERQMLAVLDDLDKCLAADAAGQQDALSRLRVRVSAAGAGRDLSAAELAPHVQALRRAPLPAPDRQRIEQLLFTVSSDRGPTTFRGSDLLAVAEKLHASHLPENLLKVRYPAVPVGEMPDPRYTFMLLNIVCITVVWFGCNNAAKEIVKEEAVYGRERAVNLGILPYLGSKFLVLGGVSALQVLQLMVVLFGALEAADWLWPDSFQAPPREYRLGYAAQYGALLLLALTGVALGLLLSACVGSPDRANALLPYVLIPQIILGGAIIPIKGEPLHALAVALSPVYWGFQAVHRGAEALPAYHPMHVDHIYSAGAACVALAAQTALLLALTAWFLRRKDVNRT